MRLLAIVPAVYLGVLVVVPGCRAAHPPSGSPLRHSTSRPPALKKTLDVLGSVEIQSDPGGVVNAYDAVTRFRPDFLRSRPGTGGVPQLPVVYLDFARLGGPDVLRSIPVHAILEIRYFTPITANSWFGPYNPGGVIAVSTQR